MYSKISKMSKVGNNRPKTQQDLISEEITRQLIELKAQLNKEILEDLKVLQQQITHDVINAIESNLMVNVNGGMKRMNRDIQAVKATVSHVNEVVCELKTNPPAAQNNQLAVMGRKETKNLVLAVVQQAKDEVFNQVMCEVNETIVPQVERMVEWVNYNTQDGGEIVTDYRRAVEHQANGSKLKMLTYGKTDKRIITPHIRTFWSESSSSEED